jgi:disulfide oxidoreductase YuzD
VELTVYGAEAVCASCVQAPPSKTTAEWLDAALSRKFGEKVLVRYIDIYQPETEKDRVYCTKILADDFFYPLVVHEDEVLGEGFIALKPIVQFCIRSGLTPLDNVGKNKE